MSRKILCIPGNDGITQYFASKIDEQGQITEYIVVGQMGGTIRGTEELFQKKRTIKRKHNFVLDFVLDFKSKNQFFTQKNQVLTQKMFLKKQANSR